MKPSTMRSPTGMALLGHFTTAPRPEITRSSVVTERIAPGPPRPVFVDASGRRGRLFRPLGLTLDCILAIPIILGGVALATDVGLPAVPWPASTGSASTSVGSHSTSGSARTTVAPVFTPSTTGARATTVRRSATARRSTTTSAGGSTPVPAPAATPPAGRQGHE